MLDVMRRQSYLIYSVFGAIIIILAINFGPGSGGCTRSMAQRGWTARVNGETIGQEAFAAQLTQQFEMFRRRAEENGRPFDAAELERSGIRRYVVEQLVQQRLMAQEARSRGLRVTDDELLAVLRGQYGVRNVSYQTYEDFVSSTFSTSVAKFEDMVREELASARLTRVMSDSIDVSEAALKRSYLRDHDRARVQYARVPIDVSEVPTPGEEAIATLMAAEPKALQDFYERDLAPYKTPERVQLRQILAVVPGDAPTEVAEAGRLKMMAVREKLIGGGDFVALAKEASEDKETADKGGELGLLARNEIAPALADAIFGQADGALAGPIRTPRGWHLIQKTAAQPAGIKALDEVRAQVAASVLRERVAASKAEQQAEQLRGALAAGAPWSKLTRAEGEEGLRAGLDGKAGKKGLEKTDARPVRVVSTWMRRVDEEVPRIGIAPELQRAIFALSPTAPVAPRVFRVDDAVYVMALKERETPDLAKYGEERADLYEEARGQKRRRMFAAWLSYLKSQAKVDINPASIIPALPQTTDEGQT